MSMPAEKEHAHELIERLPVDRISTVVHFLEFLLLSPVERALVTAPEEDEEISEEEEAAVARSKDWFQHNEGMPFEQVAAGLGFTLDQIRGKDPAA